MSLIKPRETKPVKKLSARAITEWKQAELYSLARESSPGLRIQLMPIIDKSSYRAPLCFRNGHWQTIYPTLFRSLPDLDMQRERIETDDSDFIDLDWFCRSPSSKLAILSHGLEGSSRGKYMQGMTQALSKDGWHVLAWNFRGCSGVPNRLLRSYHSGATEDLHRVVQHACAKNKQHYKSIALIGFSLGGNMTLKYLGEQSEKIDPRIQAAVTFSVACDLASSAQRLEHWQNRIYMRRFLKTLTAKVREKIIRFPGQLQDHGMDIMRTFREFDGAYTAPIHGFPSADAYWAESSANQWLKTIPIPTLLINAKDDPFLTESCYPYEQAKQHAQFHLETPQHGGHIGFIQSAKQGSFWSEHRTTAFLRRWIY